MTAKHSAIIHDTVFTPLRLGRLARQIGAHETTFGNWARGTKAMPAAKGRQFALIIDRQIERLKTLSEHLKQQSDERDRRDKRTRGNPLARAWSDPGQGPNVEHKLSPAKL